MVNSAFNSDRKVQATRAMRIERNQSALFSTKKAIENETDIGKIRMVINNARRLGNEDMVARAECHLLTLVGFQDTALDQRFLECVKRYEETLTTKNDRKTAAVRLRQAVKRNGVKQTLVNLAKKVEPSFGFEQLMKAGKADFTAEYLIVEMADEFDAETVRSAYRKLLKAGHKFNNQQ